MSFDDLTSIHRTSLIYFGRDAPTPEKAEEHLSRLVLQVHVGSGSWASRSQTAALATVINAGRRAFLGGVHVVVDDDVELVHGWATGRRLSQYVRELGGRIVEALIPDHPTIVIGDVHNPVGKVVLFPTWAGWSGGVVTDSSSRLTDSGLEIAAIAAGALGVSEAFQFLTMPPGPARREVGVSLWQPGADWRSHEVVGPLPESLPGKLWLLGLGHLGQGYAWSIGWLNYSKPEHVLIGLVDDDVVEGGNGATGMLLQKSDEQKTKARVVAREIERLGLKTFVVERVFDSTFQVSGNEPRVALAGFDKPEPRRLLGGRFGRVVDGGLGVSRSEYLSIALNTFPSTLDPEVEFSRDMTPASELSEAQSDVVDKLVAEGMSAGIARCGVTNVGGISVAAAFVGTFAGTLAVADVLRWLNGGQDLCRVRCDLRSPNDIRVAMNDSPGPVLNPGLVHSGIPRDEDRF